ncbi:hypothetical protein BN13_1110022 [Nostocoides jenkinsii Ben 74]|uniref:Uncharacterized protein n=1 Tax=Nostocoides jenkinsii Ben 74 TaxID=1193518 RepID=A0A077M4Z7_9MICO|nr:hypothetical protein BN13_1110022 [Tetrasphaera jenkinsii Ben 74]
MTPRSAMTSARVGDWAFFVGGYATTPCPPNASCMGPDSWPSDGAILDPGGRWRRISFGAESGPRQLTRGGRPDRGGRTGHEVACGERGVRRGSAAPISADSLCLWCSGRERGPLLHRTEL